MNLGTLITRLEEEQNGESALEALGDIVLLSEVCAMAEAFGEGIGAYVATSARRFAALAGDETWLGLIGAMERAPEPGQMAVRRMLRWALDTDAKELAGASRGPEKACSCGSQGCTGYAVHDGLPQDRGSHPSSIAERDAMPSIDAQVTSRVDPASGMRRQAFDEFAGLVPIDPAEHPPV